MRITLAALLFLFGCAPDAPRLDGPASLRIVPADYYQHHRAPRRVAPPPPSADKPDMPPQDVPPPLPNDEQLKSVQRKIYDLQWRLDRYTKPRPGDQDLNGDGAPDDGARD
jgi:hypothetical protein